MLEPKPNVKFELADFQLESISRILLEACSTKETGTIVCAGTGSGKTLAFYLPAMTLIAERLQGSAHWVQCIALYPRNELLKDQLNEAYQQARSLDSLLKEKGRKLLIGALFGDVPKNAEEISRKKNDKYVGKWGAPINGSYTCPYLQCPAENCNGSMAWSEKDMKAGVERLRCNVAGCSTTIEQDEIVLTRDRMRSEPPDLLFTTTEMLNQRLGDSYINHLFGCRVPEHQKPHIMLFDEVHTYEGLNGAQVAMLVRRWRHRTKAKVQYVGLSATLRDARQFFSQLVGVDEQYVEEIQPKEMISEGREYMLALRGDPVSRASLLSTTIQASMLMRRLLQPWDKPDPLAGNKVFAFTDDLNVTNRLFFNLRDAEGRDGWNQPKMEGSLANLHASTYGMGFYLDGQRWDLVEKIGHPLDQRQIYRVSRTSSQDSGVDTNADTIVATASLEVGYNDSRVGAVVQHKAPIDVTLIYPKKRVAWGGKER